MSESEATARTGLRWTEGQFKLTKEEIEEQEFTQKLSAECNRFICDFEKQPTRMYIGYIKDRIMFRVGLRYPMRTVTDEDILRKKRSTYSGLEIFVVNAESHLEVT